MKKSTIDRIISNYPRTTVIGRHTYKIDPSGEVMRCKTADVGREWLRYDGTICNGWEVVAHA